MTYGDIKKQVIDLGFEVDSEVESEYARVMLNAINRAIGVIYDDVVFSNKIYFQKNYDIDEKFPRFTSEDDDETEIEIPDILEDLVPLLAAHWLWLDDDLTKATIYWNEYDDKKNSIISGIRTPSKATIVGGF